MSFFTTALAALASPAAPAPAPAPAPAAPAAAAAIPTMPALPPKPTRRLIQLAALVPVRVPVLRKAGTDPNLARPSNAEALFGHIVGQIAAPACSHCRGGHGPWTECVVVGDHFRGACTNCQFGSEAGRCSFRKSLASPICKAC